MTLTIETLAEAMWGAQETQLVGYPEDFLPFARAILTAIEQAGYVVVPREATVEMVNAWVASDWPDHDDMSQARWNAESAQADWSAMLSAAPKIQHSEGE